MTDTTQHTEAGLFSVVAERRVRGLLVPYGEASRTNLSGQPPIAFIPGSVAIPRDPSVVGLNIQHDRYAPVGRALAFEDTPAGVVADFAIADTEEGDAYLANPHARKLSPELAGIIREGERGTAARITGAAIVTEGAFASAGLFALGDVTEAETPADDDSEHIEVQADVLPIDVTVTTDSEAATYVRTPEEETTDGAFAASATEPAAPANPEEDAVTAATAQGFAAAQPSTSAPASGLTDTRGLFAAIAAAKDSGDRSVVAELQATQQRGMFALTDVEYDATGTLPTTAGDLGRAGVITQRDYNGQLWQGNAQERLYIPQFESAPLTSLEWQSWIWDTKPLVDQWDGNKSDIPSRAPKVKAVTGKAQRFAGGNDIAREFYDFNNTEAIQAYVSALIESYALASDLYVLNTVRTAATPLVIPSGEVAPDGINDAHYKIVRGALAIITARAVPSFAFVAPDVFAQLATTPKDKTFEYLTFTAGLESGTAAGFSIIPAPDLAAGQVLVGAKRAATVRELPGSPIRVNALDIARGGVDEAVFGYTGVQVNYAPALQLVTRATA